MPDSPAAAPAKADLLRTRPTTRFYEIDFLRFLAALAVMLYHFFWRGWAKGDDLSVVTFPEIGPLFKYGYLGVDLFFIISGFVILMTALGSDPARFTQSRIVRLYPAYWFCVSVTALVIYLSGDYRFSVTLPQYVANLTMLQKFMGIPHVDGVYWSLVVELKFYFLVFLVLLFRQLHRIEELLLGWMILSFAVLLAGGVSGFNFVFFPQYAGYFIAGANFFLIRYLGLTPYRSFVAVASYALCALALWTTGVESQGNFDHFITESLFVAGFFLIFTAIALGWTSRLSHPFLVTIGTLTYPLYLIHENVGFILMNRFADALPPHVLVVLVSALMLLAAWLIHLWVEKPLGGWLRNLIAPLVARLPDRLRQQGVPAA